jgi:hypothetical protein
MADVVVFTPPIVRFLLPPLTIPAAEVYNGINLYLLLYIALVIGSYSVDYALKDVVWDATLSIHGIFVVEFE